MPLHPYPSPLQGRHWFGEDGLVKISSGTLQPELLRPPAVEYANVHQSREELQVFRNVSVTAAWMAATLGTNMLDNVCLMWSLAFFARLKTDLFLRLQADSVSCSC